MLVHPSSREALNSNPEWVVPHGTLVPVCNVLSLLRKTKRATFFMTVALPHVVNEDGDCFRNHQTIKVRWADVVKFVEESIESEQHKLDNPEKQKQPLKDKECFMYQISVSAWKNGCVFIG